MIYDKVDCAASQRLGGELRAIYPGLVYDSVRHTGGTNLGAFVPRIISDVRFEYEIELVWDGMGLDSASSRSPIDI